MPCASCQKTRGANRAAVGSGSQRRRPAPRNWAVPSTIPSATTHSTASAGARTGAHARTAARSRDALPAAPHERCATTAEWNSHGRSRCTRTAAGRPSTSAVRKVGARAHAMPAKMRRPARSVTRVAANHPPRTASGSARIHSRTTAKEGAPGHNEPSRATTAANGSAGPTTSSPTPRIPQAASLHSAPTVSRRGSRPPPPRAGQARRLVKETMLTTSAARTAHAPPPEKNRSSLTAPCSLPCPSSSRRRSCAGVTRRGAILAQVEERKERIRARERATAPNRTMAVSAAPHSGDTASGRLPTRWVRERQSARGRKVSQCRGTATVGAYARRRCSCARRVTKARRDRPVGSAAGPSGAAETLAAGARTTRPPPSRARTPRSRPSSAPARAGSGRRASRTSPRISRPRMSAPRASSIRSCCPWSNSPAASSTARPNVVMLTPRDTISRSLSVATSFGATIAADGERSSMPVRRSSARGWGAVSCARIQIAEPSRMRGRARSMASAKEVEGRASMMPSTVAATAPLSRAVAASPHMISVTAAGGRVWARTASSVRRSWARAEGPGRATMRAWTRAGMTWPAYARGQAGKRT